MDRKTCSAALGLLCGRDIDVDRRRTLMETFPELRYMKKLGLTKLALPDVIILIDLPPAEACHRITARGEPVQVHENEEKLGRLRDAYLQVCDVAENDWQVPTLILDGSTSREDIRMAAVEFVKQANAKHEANS
jgi:thymidylate kinase